MKRSTRVLCLDTINRTQLRGCLSIPENSEQDRGAAWEPRPMDAGVPQHSGRFLYLDKPNKRESFQDLRMIAFDYIVFLYWL